MLFRPGSFASVGDPVQRTIYACTSRPRIDRISLGDLDVTHVAACVNHTRDFDAVLDRAEDYYVTADAK